MVQIFERSGQQMDIGEASGFFTIGGVWEILTKTMKLGNSQIKTFKISRS